MEQEASAIVVTRGGHSEAKQTLMELVPHCNELNLLSQDRRAIDLM